MLITDKVKKETVKNILNSDVFKKSLSNSSLLQYLLKKHIEDSHIKESIIEIEFYGDDPKESSTNSKVRVNMYHLRKKLQEYYKDEGLKDFYRVNLKKGQYNLQFSINTEN